MDDILNPIAPRNPAQHVASGNALSEDSEVSKQTHVEDAEYIPLPSRGVFYTWDPKFWNLEQLLVRQLNYSDEDILTTKSYFDNGTIYNELLKNVIVDENKFPATGLIPVDRDTMLLWLRSKAFGEIFNIELTCPKCDEHIPVSWNLSELNIPTYDETVYEELKQNGEYRIITPLKQLGVKLIVPTIGKSMETEKMLAQKKIATKDTKDFYGTGSLMMIISGIEVDGKVIRNKNEIQNYFKKINLPLSDARYIRKQAEKLSLRYETKKNVQCTNCKHIEEGVEMPIVHPNFFWADMGL